MPEQLKVKPSVDCHHPASVISPSTIPAALCGPAVEGLIPRRPDDKIGVAAAYARVGDNARGFDSDIGSFGNFFYPVRSAETMVEVMYQAQWTKWWTVQSEVQYIIRPGGGVLNSGGSLRPNAWVTALRSTISF